MDGAPNAVQIADTVGCLALAVFAPLRRHEHGIKRGHEQIDGIPGLHVQGIDNALGLSPAHGRHAPHKQPATGPVTACASDNAT